MCRNYGFCLCLCLAFLSDAWASADVCEDPGRYSHLSFGLDNHSDSTIDQGPASVGLQNRDTDLQFKIRGDGFLFGIAHRYSIFDVDPLQPATNGHLHTYFLPLHVLTGNKDRSFRVSIAPALSLSSNVGDELNEYKDDAFQLLAAFIWSKRISDRTSLHYGICGDHRFGDYQIYPALSVQWQFHPDWNLQLGFPTSQLNYRIVMNLSSSIRIAPDGNEWFVLDRNLANHSQFVYEAYALEWIFDWELNDSFVISASVGRQIHNRFEVSLLDQSRVRLSGDPVTRVGAELEWRF